MKTAHVHTLLALSSSFLVACGGGGSMPAPVGSPVSAPAPAPAPSPGAPAPAPTPSAPPGPSVPPSPTSTAVSWAVDNVTRTVTTNFSDGSVTRVTDVVLPTQTGGSVITASGTNQTAPVINTFGNGVVATLQDGSAARPFQQPLLASLGNSDPNGRVSSATATYDLRWGTRAAPLVPLTTNNVSATLSSTGTAYQFTNAANGLVFGPFTDIAPVSISLPLNVSTSALQEIWATPDVRAAWAQGWTGAGVRVAVIDDFTALDRSDFLRASLTPGCGVAQISLGSFPTCASTSSVSVRLTHGDEVSMIAGGTRSTFTGFIADSGAYFNTAGTAPLGTYISVTDLSVTTSAPYLGVAPGAQMFRNDFLTYQSAANGLFGEFQRWGVGSDASSVLFRQMQVVNLSLGGTSTNRVANSATFATQLALADSTVVPDAVFVKATGNSSCVASQTSCDPLNAVFMFSPNFVNKTLLVGALDAPGGTIAGYSNTPGSELFASRFLVADGRGLDRGDGIRNEGTSFAAPRISGYAAIVRQKFPNLNAAQTASVLLDTATWNANWGAKNAANQSIYGQGEANLGRALAPVGSLR